MFHHLPLEEPIVRRDRSGWSTNEILGDELRIAREGVGLSQKELADQIAVHMTMNRSIVSLIEAGKKEITLTQLRAWMDATGKTSTVIHGIVDWCVKRNQEQSNPACQSCSESRLRNSAIL
ncbi:helix-turn-helix transcriptional regulator (plasmid) [Nostoc sp. C052]|uniref:helix-turn-helix domain-containing protein n=1 Tax=Nostoc sp. C052 TaxID=2576902 RepID=UPI0015C3ACC9|nr:helix-turn-helix transcriptional regulator [Nostoc sp. C052]QLE46567.1 helix-turn-helix transcriptional regulator [Nostoc sp. C052]